MLRYYSKYTFSPPYFTTTPAGLQSSNSGLQLQDVDSVWREVLNRGDKNKDTEGIWTLAPLLTIADIKHSPTQTLRLT